MTFLVADYSGDALCGSVALGLGAGRRSRGKDTAPTVSLSGSGCEQAVRSQRARVFGKGDPAGLVGPVTNRGDVIGVLSLRLPESGRWHSRQIAAAAHMLGSDGLTTASRDLQRRLPSALRREAEPFMIAGALAPAVQVGGDTLGYSLERDTLHVPLTDAMDALLLATPLIGSLANQLTRRARRWPGSPRRARDGPAP